METERFRRSEEIFHRALELAAAEREEFVRRECGTDLELRQGVEALLVAADQQPDFLEPATEEMPAQIGNCRLIRELGRGGMGRVYLAQQENAGFRRPVAVKLLRPEAGGVLFLRRFQAEQQILAGLEHPGIARLYDGGTTPEGVPYLVMEVVEGRTLLEDCTARGLDMRQRLELFAKVCAAVQYAHQHLVVHRDLKPSNILVTPAGEPKLLDFGIAKLLQAETGGEPAEATVTTLRMMTPAYASPEQIRGERVTTATDIYSLGVVLYELLTGVRPYGADSTSGPELEHAVLEQQPAKPSTAARAAGTTSTGALRGDLDTIVLKALAKEQSRRYATAADLADDLHRHLVGLPVRARPDARSYRLRKFLRRHRVGVGVAALAAAGLIGGATLAVVGFVRASRARAAAAEDAETARQVSEFMVGLFKISDPGEARGNAVTARELLDRGAESIDQELADQPAVRARLLRVMGRAYGELGLFAPEILAFEREIDAQTRLHGADSAEAAAALTLLSKAKREAGAYTEARDLAQRAMTIQEQRLGPRHRDLADTLSQLGVAHWYLGDLAAARQALERALAIKEGELGPDHPDLVGILNNVAILRWQLDDTAGARPLYQRALDILRSQHGDDHPDVARTLNNLAILEQQAGNVKLSRSLHERALAARRRLLAPDHPEIAESLNNRGEAARADGDLQFARQSFLDALVIREKTLGPDHPDVASSLLNLGLTLNEIGEDAEARPMLERSLAIFTAALGADHYNVALPLGGLAELDRRAGDLSAAWRKIQRALELSEKGLGPDHPQTVDLRKQHNALQATMAGSASRPAG